VTTLKHVYERQRAADLAREQAHEVYEAIYWDLEPRARGTVDVHEHPDYKAAVADADRLTAEVAALRAEAGGKVFRIVDSKLDELAARIEKLNKKAVKLGTEPITLTVSDEHEQDVRHEHLVDQETHDIYGPVEGLTEIERVIDYTFVTVNGETPMIAGWVFVASLDHEADEGADESVGIRRAPIGAFTVSRIGQEAAEAVEKADLTAYRHAGPNCDHCGWNRRRKQTYVLYEVATGELRQIGSTCLKDYTGAHNPERVAAWAEWLEALYSDLGMGGDGEFTEGSGRIAMRTDDYLANVAAVIRENGWQPRWFKSDYGDSERNYNATADVAESNYFERKPKFKIAVTDEDREEARVALEWVREDLAERDDLDEFQHNLTTYCRSDYVPKKGSGFIAYTIMARRREIEGEIKRERQAKIKRDSEWIANVGDRIKGLVWTVEFVREFESRFGVTTLTKGFTDTGNAILWFGAGGMEQGKTYSCSATVKAHETDSYNGGGKITKISNVRGVKEIEAGTARPGTETGGMERTGEEGQGEAGFEVVKTAAEREAERLRRLDPKDLEERLDSAIASYNDYNQSLNLGEARGYEKDYYREQLERLSRLITRLENDQRALKALN
jgi:hypothetical protein